MALEDAAASIRKRGLRACGLATSASCRRLPRISTSAVGRDNGVDWMSAPCLIAQSKVDTSRAATQMGGWGFCRGLGTEVADGNDQQAP